MNRPSLSLLVVIALLGGGVVAANALPVSLAREGFSVTGHVGLPTYHRGAAGYIHLVVNGRPVRDRLLGDFFSEPSWDILLDLYVQTHEGRTVTVSQLSLATGAPPTTALRTSSSPLHDLSKFSTSSMCGAATREPSRS